MPFVRESDSLVMQDIHQTYLDVLSYVTHVKIEGTAEV